MYADFIFPTGQDGWSEAYWGKVTLPSGQPLPCTSSHLLCEVHEPKDLKFFAMMRIRTWIWGLSQTAYPLGHAFLDKEALLLSDGLQGGILWYLLISRLNQTPYSLDHAFAAQQNLQQRQRSCFDKVQNSTGLSDFQKTIWHVFTYPFLHRIFFRFLDWSLCFCNLDEDFVESVPDVKSFLSYFE